MYSELNRLSDFSKKENIPNFLKATTKIPLVKIALTEIILRRMVGRTEKYDPTGKNLFLNPLGNYSQFLAWINILSWNGYHRERALRDLDSSAPSAIFLAILLRRLNDWVPQVRQAAKAAVWRAVAQTDAELVVDTLWLILPARRSWQRMGVDDALALSMISERPEIASLLAERLKTATAGPAPAVLRQASVREGLDEFLPDLSAKAVMPAVRALVNKMLIEGRAFWVSGYRREWIDKIYNKYRLVPVFDTRIIRSEIDRDNFIEAVSEDKSIIVRRSLAQVLLDNRDALTVRQNRIVQKLADDSSSTVASVAEFIRVRS
ncbi:MAG: hypothetical protein AAFV51_07315 [Pseudomonadota bacterium]